MADTKISGLTAATIAALANEFAINEAGTSKKLSLDLIRQFLTGNSGLPGNQSVASQSPAAAATTYLTNSNIAIPASGLRAGTVLRWRFPVTKTAAGTAAKSLLFKLGTAGAVGDATIITFALPVGTGVVDTGFIEIEVTIRGPLGASCIAQGYLWMSHNLATTGLINVQETTVIVTSGTFTSSTANLIAGLAFTAGVAEAWTFPQIIAESLNL